MGLSVVVLTMIFRRWRHLLVFLGAFFFLEIVGQWIYYGLSRPRPYGVTIIGSWGGYSTPSPPVAVLTVFLMGARVLPGRCPAGRAPTPRPRWPWWSPCSAWPGCTWPSITSDDVLFGVALGVAIPVTAFRFFTPNEVFPVVVPPGPRPPTSTSAAGAARRSGRPCATSSG